MPHFYLNSYGPLVATKLGRIASDSFSIPPFVDGSIRREPDLEHPYPAITCLCRTNRFAPRLEGGDVVAYITTKGRYGLDYRHWRLAAVLKVLESKATHADGAKWYRERDLALPNNCMVPGNKPKTLSQSHQKTPKPEQGCAKPVCGQWDESYKQRAKQWGTFVICEPLWSDLSWNAPVINDEMLTAAFGYIPGTQTPKTFDMSVGAQFLKKIVNIIAKRK